MGHHGHLFVRLTKTAAERAGDAYKKVGGRERTHIHEVFEILPVNAPDLGKLDRGNSGAGHARVEDVDFTNSFPTTDTT